MTTDNETLTILKLLAGGRDTAFVATATKLDVDTVTRVASHHGFPDRKKMQWGADVLERNIADARRDAAVHNATPTRVPRPGPHPAMPPTYTSPTSPVADTIANLIARGKKSDQSAKIRRAADRAETAIETLRDLLKEETAARRAAAAKVAERERERAAKAEQREQEKTAKKQEAAARKARIAELERQIRELRKTNATTPRAARPTRERTGPDPKAVRAWAATAGVECASHGRVPQSVVEQYVAAHPAVG